MELDKVLLVAGEEDPIFFAEEILGLHLNPFQKRALLESAYNKQFMWVTSNQVGKTVAIAVFHLWFNYYKKGFLGDPKLIDQANFETLNISPISRQAKEALRYADEILHSKFSWEEGGVRYINKCRIDFFAGKNDMMGRIDFKNHSSLFCLSTSEDQASGIAGKQFALITYDECVQSHHLEEELGARIFSRTAKYSGWVGLIATPDDLAKSQQYWYHLYTTAKRAQNGDGESDWYLVEGLYDENIFIPEEKREEFKTRLKKLNPAKYEQVILGKFLAAVDRMFTPVVIEGLWNGKDGPTEPVQDREYVLIIDWGVADAGDETVMGVADITDLEKVEVVKAYSKQGGDPVELMAMAGYLVMEYFDCPMVMCSTEMGGIIFKKMLKQFKPISFGQGNKPDALFFLQLKLRNNIRVNLTKGEKSATGGLKSYYLPKLERQLSTYKLDDKKIKQDWVMLLAMLAWYLEKYRKANQAKVFNLSKFYKNQSS